MTHAQQKVYDALVKFRGENGLSPSLRELAELCGITVGTIQGHLERIQREGKIKWQKGRARTLIVLS